MVNLVSIETTTQESTGLTLCERQRGDDSKAEYVCPKCGHRVVFYADEETIKSFWN